MSVSNLWDNAKEIFREKYIVLNEDIKTEGRLSCWARIQIRTEEKKSKQKYPNPLNSQKIIKLRTKINKETTKERKQGRITQRLRKEANSYKMDKKDIIKKKEFWSKKKKDTRNGERNDIFISRDMRIRTLYQ